MMNQLMGGPGDKELNDLLDFSAVSTQQVESWAPKEERISFEERLVCSI